MSLCSGRCQALVLLFTLVASSGAVAGSTMRPSVALLPVITEGVEAPVFLTHAGDRSGRLYLAEQAGRIRVIAQGHMLSTPFLDIADRVWFGGERGLLGVAFHPDYHRNGRVFVNYTRRGDGATVLSEFRRSAVPGAALQDERIVMVVAQPHPNHNGGMIAFGPEGLLYIGRGDGGAGGDPDNRGQDPHDLLGKILRIDVNAGAPYAIPRDNPFAAGGGRPEVYAVGLRNPWRFSFDPATGALWVADVGQNLWEEVDLVTRGGNYGWRVMEGTHCFNPPQACQTAGTAGLVKPVIEYRHEAGRCAVIGGMLYRGQAVPPLQGHYIYGDFCSGEIFAFKAPGGGGIPAEPAVVLRTGFQISSFGQDEAGELYVLDHSGGVYRLIERL